jgi:hypothetical protein
VLLVAGPECVCLCVHHGEDVEATTGSPVPRERLYFPEERKKGGIGASSIVKRLTLTIF